MDADRQPKSVYLGRTMLGRHALVRDRTGASLSSGTSTAGLRRTCSAMAVLRKAHPQGASCPGQLAPVDTVRVNCAILDRS